MIKLDIEVDITAPQIAHAEGEHLVSICECRVRLEFCALRPGVLEQRPAIYDMKIIVGGFSLHFDLIPAILLDRFVKALYLVLGQIVVEANTPCKIRKHSQ
jgi:hypothetical protein